MSHREQEQATQERLPVLTEPQVQRVLRWIADSNGGIDQLYRYQKRLCAGASDEESCRIIDELSVSYSSVSHGVSHARSMMMLKHFAALIVAVRDGKEE